MKVVTTKDRAKRCGILWESFLPAPSCWDGPDNWKEYSKGIREHKIGKRLISRRKSTWRSDKTLVSKGRFYFQAPDSVRWEYIAPVRSVLLMRRGILNAYYPGQQRTC